MPQFLIRAMDTKTRLARTPTLETIRDAGLKQTGPKIPTLRTCSKVRVHEGHVWSQENRYPWEGQGGTESLGPRECPISGSGSWLDRWTPSVKKTSSCTLRLSVLCSLYNMLSFNFKNLLEKPIKKSFLMAHINWSVFSSK